jgi:serine protease Do
MIVATPRLLAVVAGLAVSAWMPASAVEPLLAEEAAFRAAVARVAGAVVRIEPPAATTAAVTAAAEAGAAVGPSTGVVIDPAGLVLATEFAVPADARETVVVLPDGRRVAARPLARDTGRGIVLLQTVPIPDAAPLEVVPRSGLEPGQWTIAVGRGWSAREPSVSVGILSAVDRAWGLAVQTDASVSPMNYGGPLVDIAGRVIGIVAPLPAEPARMMRGTELYDGGIGFAVPLEDLLASLPQLRRGEDVRPGILGISYRSRDAINGEPVIAAVRQGSPAARAGLRPGDRITRIAGRTVRRIADARHAIAPRHAGDTLAIDVERDAGEAVAAIASTATLVATLPPWRRAILGLVVADPEAGEERGRAGPRIEWVLPGGPADAAGVTAGATVAGIRPAGASEVVPTPTASAVAGVVAGLEPDDTVRLELDRAGTTVTTEVRLTDMIRTVPHEGPTTVAAALDGGMDAARVVRIKAVDLVDPPVAVLPVGSTPVPVLVWCGTPHGPVAESEAAIWKAAVAATGVAVLLPGSAVAREWTVDDVEAVIRGLQAVAGERTVDPARIAVAGQGAGGVFAWLVAGALGDACAGVAAFDAAMPKRTTLGDAEPGDAKWILFGEEDGAVDNGDRARLERAGHAVGTLPAAGDSGPPAAVLCRWASLLGLL